MKSFCTYYNQDICRSCSLIELSYSEQLNQKLNILQTALSPFGPFNLAATVSSNTQGFRNKAKMSVSGTIEKPIIGLLGTENLDAGREILNCPLHHPKINELLKLLPDFIRQAKLAPYLIAEKKGELKGLILFHSEKTSQTYLRFVLRSKESIDRIKKHIPSLQEHFPGLTCVSANIQPIAHAILEGFEEVFLTKGSSIAHRSGIFEVNIEPQAFVQTNQAVAEQLYTTAAAWVREKQTKNFLELFCGQGLFSFHASSFISKGLGIELNAQAIEQAKLTKEQLQLSHLNFKASDAVSTAKDIADFQPDLLLVNPPRKGLGEAVSLVHQGPQEQIIYSSCDIHSLAKDLETLTKSFKVTRVQLFDMFPHTKHFETLVLLERI
jgi:23S rRNA (uracil747-C5)-methyltransferase